MTSISPDVRNYIKLDRLIAHSYVILRQLFKDRYSLFNVVIIWDDLAAILVALVDVDSELDKLKDDTVFDLRVYSINEENVKEATRLNSLGTQAHKDEKFSEAITFFTKATVLPSVSDRDRAVF